MLQILIADDHPIIRSGTRHLLKSHFQQEAQLHEAADGKQVLDFFREHKADVLLLDLNMPDTDPQQLIRALLEQHPGLHIVVFTMNKEVIFGPAYLRLGAKGFVPKELGEQELPVAIKAVLEGKTYIRKGMEHFYQGDAQPDDPYDVLTGTEMEVLRHFVHGASSADIAKTMNVSISAVAEHKNSIFEKLSLENLVDLKLLADLYPVRP